MGGAGFMGGIVISARGRSAWLVGTGSSGVVSFRKGRAVGRWFDWLYVYMGRYAVRAAA